MRKPADKKFAVYEGSRGTASRQFERLQAMELYCPKCGTATPVRERLLLVLPEGDKYEYLCVYCGSTVGEKIVKEPHKPILIV